MNWTIVLVVSVAAGLAVSDAAFAQKRSPVDLRVTAVSDVVVVRDWRTRVLPPLLIEELLSRQGFSTLSPPIRRGPAYVAAVISPEGEDGRVTVDALSGHIVRFRPIDTSRRGRGIVMLPDDVREAYGMYDLTPPRSIPNLPQKFLRSDSSRPVAKKVASGGAGQAINIAPVSASRPKNTKPKIVLRATQPMPPVQGFE